MNKPKFKIGDVVVVSDGYDKYQMKIVSAREGLATWVYSDSNLRIKIRETEILYKL